MAKKYKYEALTEKLEVAEIAFTDIRIGLEEERFRVLIGVDHPLFDDFDRLLGHERWSNIYYDMQCYVLAKEWSLSKDDYYEQWVKVRAAVKKLSATPANADAGVAKS